MPEVTKAVWESYEIYSQDPGDVIVVVNQGGTELEFPVTALKVDKTIEVRGEYGTGSHLPHQLTAGKISFTGSFTVQTWISKTDKESLVKLLTKQDDEGLPKYFRLEIHDRPRAVEEMGDYAGDAEIVAELPIEYYDGCMLTGDGIDIGEPGTTIARNYPFMAMRRMPK
jgi:hypothetical protein